MPDLLNLEEASKELKVSIHTVRAWSYQGKFPIVKLGRRVLIKRQDIEEFIQKNTIKPKDGE